jgi:hypothetical protein
LILHCGTRSRAAPYAALRVAHYAALRVTGPPRRRPLHRGGPFPCVPRHLSRCPSVSLAVPRREVDEEGAAVVLRAELDAALPQPRLDLRPDARDTTDGVIPAPSDDLHPK